MSLKRDPEDEALQQILGDMDGFEAKSLGGGDGKGVSITISVQPNGEGEGGDNDGDADDYPEGHDIGMCKGGCAYHKGGVVESHVGEGIVHDDLKPNETTPVESIDGDDKTLPPFLRKRKKA